LKLEPADNRGLLIYSYDSSQEESFSVWYLKNKHKFSMYALKKDWSELENSNNLSYNINGSYYENLLGVHIRLGLQVHQMDENISHLYNEIRNLSQYSEFHCKEELVNILSEYRKFYSKKDFLLLKDSVSKFPGISELKEDNNSGNKNPFKSKSMSNLRSKALNMLHKNNKGDLSIIFEDYYRKYSKLPISRGL
jgi:hypothetical protein